MNKLALILTLTLAGLVFANDETLKDKRDGKVYKLAYGLEALWFAENLDYAGPNGKLGVKDDKGKGRLYTYKEAQTACPQYWQLPDSHDVFSQEGNPPDIWVKGGKSSKDRLYVRCLQYEEL
jgi:hypothetical protein